MAKHHKHHQRSTAGVSPEEIERKAQEALASGRWRQARDHFKVLCKQDQAKYLPSLIQANRGLAEELIQKGQVSEAEQVLAHLRTLAPQEEFGAVELLGMIRNKDWSGALQSAVQLWKARAEALNEHDRQSVADALVLAFPEVDDNAAMTDCPEPLGTELKAVLHALRCVSAEQYEQAQELLRPLGRSSIFAAWKTLIKGWIAFYLGSPEKAQTLLAMVPSDSVPGRAAAPVRVLADPKIFTGMQGVERDQAAAALCRFQGASGLANVLVQADTLWTAGKVVESFHMIRRAGEFPTREPSGAGAISEFYFRAASTLHGEIRDRYLTAFAKLPSGGLKNSAENYLLARALANEVLLEQSYNSEALWRNYLLHFERDPRRPKLTSLALEAVAAQSISEAPRMPFFSFGPRTSRQGDRQAVKLLKESIELDPQNLSASLKLLDLYEESNSGSEKNRLLDAMTRRFPHEKAVLLRAGTGCVERKSYVKGLEYLQKASLLDPLDKEVIDELAEARIQLARQQYEKKQTAKARETFQLLLDASLDDRFDPNRSRDFLHARQGVLEILFGERTFGEERIAEARKITRSLPALLMLAHGCCRFYLKKGENKESDRFWTDLEKVAPKDARERLELLQMFDYVRQMGEKLRWKKEGELVARLLEPAARKQFTPQEARELIPLLIANQQLSKLAKQLINAGLRHQPKSPCFRLFDIAQSPIPPVHRLAEIEEIRHDAQKEGDTKTAEAAAEMIQALEFFASPLGVSSAFDDEFIDDAAYDDDEPDIPSMQEIEELKRITATMSDEEFEALRQESADILPPHLFDALIGTRQKASKRKR